MSNCPPHIMNPAGKYWCSSGSFGGHLHDVSPFGSSGFTQAGRVDTYLIMCPLDGYMMSCFVEKGDSH
eukprot:scaffold510_cov141-Skeletonema_marinoi.AAC.2